VKNVRVFLSIEAVAFGLAALVHSGLLIHGYEHREARIAESVIGTVLLLGLAGGIAVPPWSRAVALGVQGFALLGTGVGIFTMIVGHGPQSWFDVTLHTALVSLLISGLIVVGRRAESVAASFG